MVQSLEKTKLLHNHICISPSTEQAYFNRNMRKLIVLSPSTSRRGLEHPQLNSIWLTQSNLITLQIELTLYVGQVPLMFPFPW